MVDWTWIKQRIKSLREERGWSEYVLAQEAEISTGTIYDWKNKSSKPSLESIEALCTNAFKISLSQFFAKDESEAKTAAKRKLDSVCEELTEQQLEMLVAMANTWKK